jgi:hypothetical protein
MKKTILTITFMTVVLSTFAQVPFTFDLGIKAGINSSKVTTDNPSVSGYTLKDLKNDSKSGFNVGAFARLGGKKVYLQPELLYCTRNSETTFGFSTDGSTVTPSSQTVSLKTIQVPVLLGFKLLDLKLASIRAFTGPAMSIVMNNSNVTYDGITTNLSDTKNYKNNIWDWQLGAGVDVGPLVLDVRYEWGLSNISDGKVANVNFVNKGNVLTFSLGFKFI